MEGSQICARASCHGVFIIAVRFLATATAVIIAGTLRGAPFAQQAPVVIQQATCNSASPGSACTATFNSPVTVGNCVIATVVQAGSNAALLTNGSNSMSVVWGHDARTSLNDANTPMVVLYSGMATSSGTQVNVMPGVSSQKAFLSLLEVANVQCTALDGTNSSYSMGTNQTSFSTGAITAAANDFIIAVGAANGANKTITGPSSPWRALTGTTSWPSVAAAVNQSASPGHYNVGFVVGPASFTAGLIAAFPAGTSEAFATHFNPEATGIYCGSACYANQVPNATALADRDVAGFRISANWSQLETADGVYNWPAIDNELNAVVAGGKKVAISVQAGYLTPNWVYTEGAASLTYKWWKSWGPGYCANVTIPVPWDPVFLSKWGAFIAALGARYNSNPNVVRVNIGGLNSDTPETYLPFNRNASINHGQCTSYDDVQNWINLGYTRVKVETAWNTIASDFYASFSNPELVAELVSGGFPPLDNNGNLFGSQTVDHDVSTYILDSGEGSNSLPQFGAMEDALTSTNNWPTLYDEANRYDIGEQTYFALGSPALSTALTNALNAGDKFVELYLSDLNNPANATAIHNAAVALSEAP
jgi:hypothetical protein